MKNLNSLFPLLFLLLTLFFSGCETSPPVEQSYLGNTAKIVFNSTPAGAAIFIDGLNTNCVTPDTIDVKIGTHQIKLIKDGYYIFNNSLTVEDNNNYLIEAELQVQEQAKIVLIEDFANVSCAPCVFSNSIIKSLTQSTYGHSKVVAISYHSNFPSLNDPFYLSGNTDISNAMNFYNIYYVPTSLIDGRSTSNSLDSISIKSAINTNLQKIPNFRIDVSKTIKNDSLFILVSINKLNQSITEFDNLNLKIAVVESEIEFSTPPGNNLETKFYDIMRKMVPNFTGTSLNQLTLNNFAEFSFTAYIKPEWQKDKLQVISFIQNIQTKEVLQTNSTF